MITTIRKKCLKIILFSLFFAITFNAFSQDNTTLENEENTKSNFWKRVQVGGGLGLNIGSGFTNIAISPSAIYNINPYFSAGLGLQGSYVSSKNSFNSIIYGGSLIGLANPTENIQLSAELEQVRVNTTEKAIPKDLKFNNWNTALFLGAGYRSNNFILGIRYNILHNKNNMVYSDAFMPFIRVFF